MKLTAIFEAAAPDGVSVLAPLGTFIGLRPSQGTIEAIERFIIDNDIPNPTPSNELHCTVAYSKTFISDYTPPDMKHNPMIGVQPELDLFNGQDGGKVLVIKFNSGAITRRHEDLLTAYNLKWKYKDYQPHVTISYDLEDYQPDIAKLTYKLSNYLDHLEFVEEYEEPVDTDDDS